MQTVMQCGDCGLPFDPPDLMRCQTCDKALCTACDETHVCAAPVVEDDDD